MITPQEYTRSVMHHPPSIFPTEKSREDLGNSLLAKPATNFLQIPDIENNVLEVMKKKLKVYDERLVKLEDKIFDKGNCIYCLSDWCKFAEVVCLWTLVIMLSIKVFN